jgi:putative membrane protein
MPDAPTHFDASPSASNHFAWMRTEMALQRTLMAAVRTAVSLIGFGFTVAQFFQKLAGKEGHHTWREETPRNVGLVLIGAGVLSLILFTFQYHQARRYMDSGELGALAGPHPLGMHTSTYMVAYTVILIGLGAFGSVFFRFG